MSDSLNLCCVTCSSILDKAAFAGLEVDLCPKCGGLWLERGAITRAAKLPDSELAQLRALLASASGPPPIPTEDRAPCPACPGTLSEVLLGAISVDSCTACQGLFLDRGQLSAALASVQARDRETQPHDIVIALSPVTG